MDRKNILSSAIICVLFVSSIIFISQTSFTLNNKEQQTFYVGVTYGGNSIEDAKTLIDKVANYTNLFVLQSGILMYDNPAVSTIGDYAVSRGMHFAVYFDPTAPVQSTKWLGNAEQRWGAMFAGIYLGDEPGGKFLDSPTSYTFKHDKEAAEYTISKDENGVISYSDNKNYTAKYYQNGTITATTSNKTNTPSTDPNNSSIINWNTLINTNLTTYEPNGSITIWETIISSIEKVYTGGSPYGHHEVGHYEQVLKNDFYTMENGSTRIAQEETYQQMLNGNPLSDFNDAANIFVKKTSAPVDDLRKQLDITNHDFPVFTADYGLYWWDYKSGYDMVLAELGWNNSVAQEIALVRGAANLQGKSWGTILTWKYTQAPYLADGDEIFSQMKASYENGAQYVILFNYAKDMSGPYGTLQEEHFQALERFWNEVVQNPTVVHGGVEAQAVLVLPENYGWGMRNPNDSIWGIWKPDNASSQFWTQVQSKLEQYGTQLDIVYSDSAYPFAGRYSNVYVLNKTP